MSIYQDILTAQVKQGNFGGKKGQFGYLVDEEKRRKKANKAYEKTKDRRNYKIEITNGVVDVATDSNGLSDPYVRVGKKGKLMNKWIYQTKAHEKTLAPVWCEEFETTVTCPAEIVVELWDKDTLKDDYIGQATVTLTGSTLWAHTLVMTDKKGQRSGEVKLTFQEGSSRGYMTSF